MTPSRAVREIPFNYTSADDRQAVSELLGPAAWDALEQLRARRVTGRSARLLMRFFGEILVHRRNPFLFEELVGSSRRRRRFFSHIETDLSIIDRNSRGEELVAAILERCRRLLAGFRRDVEGAPALRRRILGELGPLAGPGGVLFDPFTLVSPRHRRHRLAPAPAAWRWRCPRRGGPGGAARLRPSGGSGSRPSRAAPAPG